MNENTSKLETENKPCQTMGMKLIREYKPTPMNYSFFF
jgi:hypothetical protein